MKLVKELELPKYNKMLLLAFYYFVPGSRNVTKSEEWLGKPPISPDAEYLGGIVGFVRCPDFGHKLTLWM